jgi:hypothetical protein
VRLQGTEFNANTTASRIDRTHPAVQAAMEQIAARAARVGNSTAIAHLVRTELQERLDQWLAEAHNTAGGRMLGYTEERNGLTVGLLHRPSLDPWDDFTCLNSLRDVEPTVGLVFDDGGLDDDPSFVTLESEDTDPDEDRP